MARPLSELLLTDEEILAAAKDPTRAKISADEAQRQLMAVAAVIKAAGLTAAKALEAFRALTAPLA